MADTARLTGLPEDERNLALKRFKLLRPFFEEGVPLARIAQQQGLALRTARRWAKQYREGGMIGLARKARADRGRHRRLTPEQRFVIESLARQTPRPTVAFIHRQVVTLAQSQDQPIPSYACVYAIVQRLQPVLIRLGREVSTSESETFDSHERKST